MVAINQYVNLLRNDQRVNELGSATQEVYESQGARPSMKSKNLAASLYNSKNIDYSRHLVNDPTKEEVYNVLSEGTYQANERLESNLGNLEGILRDAQLVKEGLVEFAAENVKPIRTGNKAHNAIANAHKAYNEGLELIQNYELEIRRKRKGEEEVGSEARDKIFEKLCPVYDELYKGNEKNKALMKQIADFADDVLIADYTEILKQAEKDFKNKLNGNEVSYLSANANALVDKSGFIRYLLSGKEEELVKSAQANDDEVGAQAIHKEIRQNRMMEDVQSTPQARRMNLTDYGASSEQGPILSRAQAQTPSILVPYVN
tara:strand:- start:2065 stop:3018 length:954 start_codon:yes stop_codon:yes gene_type:complete